MRQRIFTLLLISAVGLTSCRKDRIEQNIQQFDQSQIENYISVHGLTGMKKDTSGGDTTGIYYKLILPGQIVPPATSLVPLDYPDMVSFVFTMRSFDGKYVKSDTIQNHTEDYLGHLTNDNLPPGFELAVKNILKYRGASARVLIPSRLAYGVNGFGTGSSDTANTRIAGNQCLDYYVHLIADYKVYDQQVIKNNYDISSYTAVNSRLYPGYTYYYKILTNGTGTSTITENTTITCTYTGSLLNGTVFDGSFNGDNIATQTISDLIPGVREGLEDHAVAGTKISLILPSKLGYDNTSSGTIPVYSCLRFTYQIITTTP